MKRSIGMNISPSLKQSLNPAVYQQLKLLHLPFLELVGTVNMELEENPLLAIDGEETETPSSQEGADSQEAVEEPQGEKPQEDEPFEERNSLDLDLIKDFFERDDEPSFLSQREEGDENLWEKIIPAPESLWEKLTFQARLEFDDPKALLAAEFLIYNLNEKGFLNLTEEETDTFLEGFALEANPFGPEELESVRRRIQAFDPPGLASRDVRECLLFQSEFRNSPESEGIRDLLENHFDLFLKGDLAAVGRSMGIERGKLDRIVEELKKLEPYPGEVLIQTKTEYVIPDAVVLKEGDGYGVYLNDDQIPRLALSGYYRKLIDRMKWKRGEEARYLRQKLDRAMAFIHSLDYRNRSLYKVAKAIVERQKDFLESGPSAMKPMKLKDIAGDIDLHETTVSRVVSQKYMMTPLGLFPMKFFFTSALKGTGGEELSSLSIKERIKRLVEGEDPGRPLSDDKLTDILLSMGVKIKRRTVAKYREELEIPSSLARKKIKKGVKP